MPSKRTFHKTVIQVVVLSEDPINPEDFDLDMVAYEITQGDYSGQVTITGSQEIDGSTMAKLLQEQGSDPGFFSLTEEGEEEEESPYLENT